MKNYEIIDTTADIGIRAFGPDLPAIYTNAALGMFNLIVDVETIQERLERAITVTASDKEGLLAEWLNEFLFLFDTELLLFKRFEITELSQILIRANCFGEKVDRSRHELKRGIKSATYHKLKVERQNDGSYLAEVIFDI
jgi:SHS2 domain-containing protein